MLNQTILMGRLTRDPETRYMQGSDNSVTRFTLAVDRDYQKQGEERKADFINCIAWNKTGEFIERFFRKGAMIAVTGSIETGSYTNKDGVKVYTTDINVHKASFTGEKHDDSQPASRQQPAAAATNDGFMEIPQAIEEELPFN